jgi:hypothetical protein
MNDERLRQRLREGDPAAGEGGLPPDEVRAMRRTVLTATPEPRRRLLPALALAGAAAAILIAIFALRPGPARTAATTRIAAVPAPPRGPSPIAQLPVQPEPQPLHEEERRQVHPPAHHRHHRRSAAPAVNDTLASLEPASPEPPERQIQFSAPGGTRIIWILKSGKASR